jgi:hypothetical protein
MHTLTVERGGLSRSRPMNADTLRIAVIAIVAMIVFRKLAPHIPGVGPQLAALA